MREIWTRPESFFVEVVECRKPAREKLAIDHTFGEAFDAAESHTLCQFIDAVAHQLFIARRQRREAVANDNPICELSVDQPTLAPCLANHLSVVAFTRDAEIGRI